MRTIQGVGSRGWAEAAAPARGVGVGLLIAILGYYVVSEMPETGNDVFSATLRQHAITLVLALMYAGYLLARRRLPGGNALDWPVILVLGCYLLSTATSIDMRVSLERTLRVLVALLIFAAVVDLAFITRKELERGLMLIGGLASLYALWVVAGDYLDWLSFARSVDGGLRAADLIPPTVFRIHGVSDHPNILGMTLVLILPFYVTTVVRPEWGWERVAAAVGLVATGLTIFLTLSRGAWLGAVVAVGLTAVLVGFERYGGPGEPLRRAWGALRRRPLLLGMGAVAVVAALALLSLLAASRIESRPEWLFRRSLSPRYDALAAGKDMFLDYPLVGAGPGSYALLYPVYSGEYPEYGFHAHNGYLEAAVELGLLGVVALAVGGGMLAWIVWRAYREGGVEEKLVAAACAGALGGFLVHNIADAANLWKAPLAALAVVAAIAVRDHQSAVPGGRGGGAPAAIVFLGTRVATAWRLFPRIVLVAAFVGLFVAWGWIDTAHSYYSQSLESIRQGRVDEAVQQARRATEIDPTLAVYHLHLGVTEFRAAEQPATRQLLDDAIRELRRAAELDPRSAVTQANLAQALAQAGDTEEAKAAALRAMDLAGADATTVLAVGTVFEEIGATEEAIRAYSVALSWENSLVDSAFWTATEFRQQHRAEIGDASYLAFEPCTLGSLLARSSVEGLASTSDLENLEQSCALMVVTAPGDLDNRVALAEILLALGRNAEARDHLTFALDRQPDLGPARTALGKWYAAEGDLASARHEWAVAGQLSQAEALVLLGDTYPPGEVPEGVVARLEQLAPVVAGGARWHEVADSYYRMKFGREPPPNVLIPGEWQTALPGQYVVIEEALLRWRSAAGETGDR
jgi:tetratricopeptide (TPR) repeat protein